MTSLETFYMFCDEINACVNSGGIGPIDIRKKEIIEKQLKALEIIKRTALKLVSLEDDTTICRKGRYAFYDSELYLSEDVTKEEYNLLKEILL